MKKAVIRRFLAGFTAAALIFSGTGGAAAFGADESIAETALVGESEDTVAVDEDEQILLVSSEGDEEELDEFSTDTSEDLAEEEPTEEPTEEPVYEEPTEEPVYEEPTEEPVYEEPTEEPVYEEPTEEPVYEEPTEEPVYEEPTEEPVYEEPTEEPVYEEPTEEPVYEEPTEEPVYEEPTEVPTEEPTEEPTDIPEETPAAEETPEPAQDETTNPVEVTEDTGDTIDDAWTDVANAGDNTSENTESSVEGATVENTPTPVAADPALLALVGASETPTPTTATPTPAPEEASLDLSMVFLRNPGKDNEKEMYLASGPYIYVYLEQVVDKASDAAQDGTAVAVEPKHYLLKLTYNMDSKTSTESSYVEVGDYKISYYTAAAGKGSACDKAASGDKSTKTDPSQNDNFRRIGKAGYAGGNLKLYNAPTEVTVKKGGTSLDLISSVPRASLTLAAYKNITGVSDTEAVFAYQLFRSDRTATAVSGDPILTAETSGKIKQGIGKGVNMDSVVFTEAGYYYFILREDTSEDRRVGYFSYDPSQVKMQIKVEETDGLLRVTKFTSGDQRSVEFIYGDASNGNHSVAFRGVNPTVTDDTTAERYTYELYGPLAVDAKANEDGTYEGSSTKASLVSEQYQTSSGTKTRYAYTFPAVTVNTTDNLKYVIIEKYTDDDKKTTVNREHTTQLVLYTDTEDDGTVSLGWRPIIYGANFTNTYQFNSFTKKLQFTSDVSGTPKTPETYIYTLKNSAGATVATKTIKGEGTDGWTIRFRKAGTYTYTLTEQKSNTKGFTNDTTKHTIKFVVTDDKQGNPSCEITVDGKKLADTDTVAFTYENSYNVSVKVALLNTSKKAIKGGKLKVTDSNGKKVDSWTTNGKRHLIEKLTKDGTYTLTETKAPDDYVKAAAIKFTVENGKVKGLDSNVIKMYNEKAHGSFTFYKISGTTGRAVGGATFTLYKIAASKGSSTYKKGAKRLKKGTIAWDYLTTVENQQSAATGKVSFENLNPNTYYVIQETASASGYQKSANAIIVKTTWSNSKWQAEPSMSGGNTITRNGTTGAYEWRNYPARVMITMRSSSGAYLKGAKLALTDTTTGQVVESWTSGSTSHAVRARMVVGRAYKLEQTNRLRGYTNSDPITFTVDAQDTTNASPIQYVTFTATKNPVTATASPVRPTNRISTVTPSVRPVTVAPTGTTSADGRTVVSAGGTSPSPSGSVSPSPTGSGTANAPGATVVSVGTETPTPTSPTATVVTGAPESTDSAAASAAGTPGTATQANAADTGDNSPIIPLAVAMAAALLVIVVVLRKKRQ